MTDKLTITLDLDKLSSEEFGTFLDALIDNDIYNRIEMIETRISASTMNYHVRLTINLWSSIHDCLEQYDKKAIDIFMLGARYALQDCLGRVKADAYRLNGKTKMMRLFGRKDGKDASEWLVYMKRDDEQ